MKLLLISTFIVSISVFSSVVVAEDLCPEAPKESNSFYWSESDFTEKSSAESMKALQSAIANNGEIGECHLPNALAIVEGYILKRQALFAISNDSPPAIVQYNTAGFCDFLKYSKPCE
ncbi:hypothetical protein [uncultured Psychrosphaera sp.]|uniref:hypothetical protein n=1 Tax=uncultured Psychrosphaera sp. TaxID=1403522 RepID=UPI00262A8781|nr:hypothetical protein [uncultured Psychrosphaera sp.]